MLEDVLAPGLRAVFCGTAVGTRTSETGYYYVGRGNKFWLILAEVGLTDRVLEPHEFREVLAFGLGLTDIVKGQLGPDSTIDFQQSSPDAVRQQMLRLQPRFLCFNGKRAAKEFLGVRRVKYGELAQIIGATRLFVLPSTSGSGARWWGSGWWQALSDLARSA